MFRQLLKSDFRAIIRSPILIIAVLIPLVLILFLRFAYPFISDFCFSKNNFLLDNYYSVIAVTIVSVIPMVIGFANAFLIIGEPDMPTVYADVLKPGSRKYFIVFRIIIPAVLAFLVVLAAIHITKPVPEEGWLRTIYVSAILAAQTPFAMLFIASLSGNRLAGIAISKLYGIFLIAVPFGLLVHNPWYYLAFFSPFYWISWAWVTSVQMESLMYGAISIMITAVFSLLLYRHFLKKHTT